MLTRGQWIAIIILVILVIIAIVIALFIWARNRNAAIAATSLALANNANGAGITPAAVVTPGGNVTPVAVVGGRNAHNQGKQRNAINRITHVSAPSKGATYREILGKRT